MRYLPTMLLAASLGVVGMAQATTITYTDFSSTSGLTLNGNAAQVGNVLRVTPANFGQAGSVFSTNPISLASNVSFSTAFQFRFTNAGGACDGLGCGADGLVFVVQTNSNSVGGGGGGIGYQGVPNSVGIEFDTWNNGFIDGNSSNHVGIDVGGDVNSVVRAEVTLDDMNNGGIWYSWIDYNGVTDLLEVRLSQTSARPSSAILSLTRDLAADLGTTNAFVGFTSGTGAAYANHDVLSWTFVDTFNPINRVPEPASLALMGLGFAGLAFVRRRKKV
ncbi:MAG: lectin-like domain-containing protein [Pseudomonadota bacterium]